VVTSDYLAIIGAITTGAVLIINTYYSARAKTLADEAKIVATDTNRLARRHEDKTDVIATTLDTVAHVTADTNDKASTIIEALPDTET
jgi:hypothetical protein